jgi:hypothetical protein
MKIYRIRLNKEEVLRLPDQERRLFCSIAHLQNEINILLRAVLWSHDFSSDNEAEVQGQVSVTLFFVRLLAGKLREGWTILEKYFFVNRSLATDFRANANSDQTAALDELSRYFGRANILHEIRTNFAFHYSPEEIDNALATTPDDLVLYIEEEGNANTLYYFAEVLANRAAINRVPALDADTGLDRLIDEGIDVAKHFTTFGQAFMSYIVKKHQPSIWQETATPVLFSDLPSFAEMHFPWFTDTTSGLRRAKKNPGNH